MLRKTLVHRVVGGGKKIVVPSTMHTIDDIGAFVGGEQQKMLQRRRHMHKFQRSVEMKNNGLYKDSKPHLRKQQDLIERRGVAGAVEETLRPSKTSFREDLRQRPLDRKIMEEIYKEVHGKRTERTLKRGMHWERWVAQGTGTAPIFTASDSAQKLFGYGGKIEQLVAAKHHREFPLQKVPEIAFMGRTNVGKSSLVNAILNAYTCPYGHLQGTTTTVDFLSIADRMTIVDLPGYGYYNPLQATDSAASNAKSLVKEYLRDCGCERKIRNIKRVFVCISCRGMQHSDTKLLDFLEKLQIPFSVVITKTDTAGVRFLARMVDYTRCQLVNYSCCNELMMTSSLRLSGINKVQSLVANMGLREAENLDPISMDMDSIV